MTYPFTRAAQVVGMLGVAALLSATPAQAQQRGTTTDAARPFGLDPYKPSDAKILRELGPTLVTQMSASEIQKLDPYKPTDAALLRQMGGGIPVCCLGAIWPVGGVGFGPYAPVIAFPTRPIAAPRPAPAATTNVVWVCRGTACAGADARTHAFSRPPVQP